MLFPKVYFLYAFLCQMASELHALLGGAVSLTTGERVMPAYGGHEAFLKNVVFEIYEVIRKVM